MPKNVCDIVKAYLVDNGYDGLCNDAGECGCEVSDLFPCGEADIYCEPGHKAPCPKDCGDHDWHIVPGEPKSVCLKTGDDTAHLGPFTTVRSCVDCGCLISGGPTRCRYCADKLPKTEGDEG